MQTRPLAPMFRGVQASAGFTMVEMILVLVILGIVSVVAIPRATNTNALTLDVQSRALVSTLLSAQMVAYSTGQNVTFCTLSNSGTYAYWAQSSSTCSTTTVPSTSPPFPASVVLSHGVTFSATPSTALTFSSMGHPTASTDTTYTLAVSGSSQTYTATVATLTGFVSLNPP